MPNGGLTNIVRTQARAAQRHPARTEAAVEGIVDDGETDARLKYSNAPESSPVPVQLWQGVTGESPEKRCAEAAVRLRRRQAKHSHVSVAGTTPDPVRARVRVSAVLAGDGLTLASWLCMVVVGDG